MEQLHAFLGRDSQWHQVEFAQQLHRCKSHSDLEALRNRLVDNLAYDFAREINKLRAQL